MAQECRLKQKHAGIQLLEFKRGMESSQKFIWKKQWLKYRVFILCVKKIETQNYSDKLINKDS